MTGFPVVVRQTADTTRPQYSRSRRPVCVVVPPTRPDGHDRMVWLWNNGTRQETARAAGTFCGARVCRPFSRDGHDMPRYLRPHRCTARPRPHSWQRQSPTPQHVPVPALRPVRWRVHVGENCGSLKCMPVLPTPFHSPTTLESPWAVWTAAARLFPRRPGTWRLEGSRAVGQTPLAAVRRAVRVHNI